jgi:hypothetical protein
LKKITLLGAVALLFGFGSANAQSFSDDFESYNVGDYIGANSSNWTTWSGTTGGAEDAKVVNDKAASGTNSIYFAGSAAGGPQDVVLPFQGAHETGEFVYAMKMFIESGKTAYFNFQAETAIGTTWALDCNFNGDGTFTLNNGVSGSMGLGLYNNDAWVNVELKINLSQNIWQFYVDGTMESEFQNGTNKIASLDLFPLDATGQWWVDDVSYSVTPYTLPTLNAGVSYVGIENGLVGFAREVTAKVRNLGTTDLTSFDVSISYDGATLNETVTGVSVASLAEYDVAFSGTATLAAGTNVASVTVSNVNSGTDDDSADDTKSMNITPITPGAGKVVVGEEATGTWCPWCTRGTHFMHVMEESYKGYWAGIAVHNGDPMVVSEYDQGIGALIGGYPSGVVDRGAEVDPSGFPGAFLENVQMTPAAIITNGAFYDATTAELAVSLKVDFSKAVSGDWRLICVLTEDSVHGTGADWSQANAYAGGGSGPMGGFENLPSPIPFDQISYDHVARAISPSFEGKANSFPTSVADGDSHTLLYSFSVPADWNTDKMHIIGMLINDQGVTENGSTSSINEATAHGLDNGSWITGVTLMDMPDKEMMIYPNPNDGNMVIKTNIDAGLVKVFDVEGRLVNTTTIPANGMIELNDNLETGIYIVNVYNKMNEVVATEKLMVK